MMQKIHHSFSDACHQLLLIVLSLHPPNFLRVGEKAALNQGRRTGRAHDDDELAVLGPAIFRLRRRTCVALDRPGKLFP